MPDISYIGDERPKKGKAVVDEAAQEETPLPEGPPSRAESGSLASVRVGTTEQISRLCRLLLSFMTVTMLCHLNCVHLLLTLTFHLHQQDSNMFYINI